MTITAHKQTTCRVGGRQQEVLQRGDPACTGAPTQHIPCRALHSTGSVCTNFNMLMPHTAPYSALHKDLSAVHWQDERIVVYGHFCEHDSAVGTRTNSELHAFCNRPQPTTLPSALRCRTLCLFLSTMPPMMYTLLLSSSLSSSGESAVRYTKSCSRSCKHRGTPQVCSRGRASTGQHLSVGLK